MKTLSECINEAYQAGKAAGAAYATSRKPKCNNLYLGDLEDYWEAGFSDGQNEAEDDMGELEQWEANRKQKP